jgi:hypothetical protein
MDSTGDMNTTTGAIRKVFCSDLQTAYNRLIEESSCADDLHAAIEHTAPKDLWDALDAPITENEIRLAIQKAAHNKSPGMDWSSTEFYVWSWKVLKALTIMCKTMFKTGQMTSAEKQGIIVCIPKKGAPTQVKD